MKIEFQYHFKNHKYLYLCFYPIKFQSQHINMHSNKLMIHNGANGARKNRDRKKRVNGVNFLGST